ncbi:MAG: HTTM domain-containing protein [Myxococcota bacterium]
MSEPEHPGRTGRVATLWRRAHVPVDPASLVAFRVAFGLLGVVSAFRFLDFGWDERLFAAPIFRFRYFGLDWVPVPASGTITAIFVALMVLGGLVALGLFYRVAVAAFAALFTYVQLIDVTTYLNHYVLVSLLALWMSVMPLAAHGSLDAWLRRRRALPEAPPLRAWMLWALRLQIGVVYVNAALAKATPDWLLHGQPMGIWLAARTDTPLVGGLFGHHETALVLGWAGFLYDLSIPLWLSWRRTRVPAYVLLLVFHGMTHVLFDIGMFPFIMSVAATIFFDPSWPRRVFRWREGMRRVTPRVPTPSRPRLLLAAALALFSLVQVLWPLRTHAYGGNVLWHEQGMRFSWRVMCREKNGSIRYRVRWAGSGRERYVFPQRYLTDHQEREMAGQPDLVLQLAHHVAEDHVRRGHEDVEVRVDAWVSLNGRPMARMIDPDVDLAQVDDGFSKAAWILPAPSGAPIRLRRPAGRVAEGER